MRSGARALKSGLRFRVAAARMRRVRSTVFIESTSRLKPSKESARAVTLPWAFTVAPRGTGASSAVSPKQSPAESSATTRSSPESCSWMMSTVPSTMA